VNANSKLLSGVTVFTDDVLNANKRTAVINQKKYTPEMMKL